jgi:hypothetical protein
MGINAAENMRRLARRIHVILRCGAIFSVWAMAIAGQKQTFLHFSKSYLIEI